MGKYFSRKVQNLVFFHIKFCVLVKIWLKAILRYCYRQILVRPGLHSPKRFAENALSSKTVRLSAGWADKAWFCTARGCAREWTAHFARRPLSARALAVSIPWEILQPNFYEVFHWDMTFYTFKILCMLFSMKSYNNWDFSHVTVDK